MPFSVILRSPKSALRSRIVLVVFEGETKPFAPPFVFYPLAGAINSDTRADEALFRETPRCALPTWVASLKFDLIIPLV